MARSLVVWFTADVHDRRGFGAKLAEMVAPGDLLVDCGDSLRGSSTVYRAREPVIAEFARAPYRAQAVGNREFHYLHRFFAARALAMPMPMLCTNLEDLRRRLPAPYVPELTVETPGASVRLLALLVPQYRTGSAWERVFGWRFLSPEAALEQRLRAPGDARHDATIVLSHLGLDADRTLAARFPQLSAIAGGHSHALLTVADIVSGVPIVHAGAYARFAGRIEFAVDERAVAFAGYRLVPLLDAGAEP